MLLLLALSAVNHLGTRRTPTLPLYPLLLPPLLLRRLRQCSRLAALLLALLQEAKMPLRRPRIKPPLLWLLRYVQSAKAATSPLLGVVVALPSRGLLLLLLLLSPASGRGKPLPVPVATRRKLLLN